MKPARRRDRRSALRIAAALVLTGALAAGCATVNMLPGEGQVAAPTLSEPRPAIAAGHRREHARILAAYGGTYSNAKLEAELARTVDRLTAVSARPDLKYHVIVLNSPAINAFALPSGQIYLTRGLIALANDRAELASVVAHEMAHVIARHATIREDQMRQATLVNRVATDLLSDPALGALAMAKSKIALANFSRAQELEADGIGVGIAARAGFDPYGAERFLTSMGANAALRARSASIDPRAPDFVSSHPATAERVENVRANARRIAGPGVGVRERDDYLAMIDGLTYGEDPTEGFVRGRRFLHPKLGFTFSAPEGFALDNAPQAVFGVKDNGDQALRLDIISVPAGQPLAEYLVSGWIDGIEPRSVESFTINGLPAATAAAKGDRWGFRIYLVRLGTETYRFIFAAKNRSEAAERSFRHAVNSFRRMTQAEMRQARPLRMKVVTVQPGDSVERLAHRMAVADRHVDRFRVLNGLGPGERLSPGSRVKLVTE